MFLVLFGPGEEDAMWAFAGEATPQMVPPYRLRLSSFHSGVSSPCVFLDPHRVSLVLCVRRSFVRFARLERGGVSRPAVFFRSDVSARPTKSAHRASFVTFPTYPITLVSCVRPRVSFKFEDLGFRSSALIQKLTASMSLKTAFKHSCSSHDFF